MPGMLGSKCFVTSTRLVRIKSKSLNASLKHDIPYIKATINATGLRISTRGSAPPNKMVIKFFRRI